MTPMHRPRRALLFTPGDQAERLEKSAALGLHGVPTADGLPVPLDAVIADLEDGVTVENKAAARDITRAALTNHAYGRAERIVRINPVSSPFWRDDLAGTIDAQPDAYLIAKVEAHDHVTAAADWLSEVEAARGWPQGQITLLALIESARGVAFVREIAMASPRLTALCFGAEDLAGSMGAIRQADMSEAQYARSAVVLHAKAFGLQAIDTPFIRLGREAMDDLAAETRTALALGYDGKLTIHPSHVPVLTPVFIPSAEEVDAARRLIAAFEDHEAAGQGAFAYDGRMIDQPAIRHARAVLARSG